MTTIHFIGGEKGGVGKSVVARLLCQYFIDHAVSFTALDADASHGALLRYYTDFAAPVDLGSFASADGIIDAALAGHDRVVVDLPAQSADRLAAWMAASDVSTFAEEESIDLVFWHVSDGGFDSLQLLERFLGDRAGQVRCVVVRNWGRSSHFGQFDESGSREQLAALGGRVLDLPALDSESMYAIDRLGSSMWAAVHTTEGERALGAMSRRRVARWLSACEEQFESLERWL